MSDQNRKRKKAFYQNASKVARYTMEANMKGFLITCNNREKEAVREAYNIFNQFADERYDAEKKDESEDGSDNEEDIEDALEKEVAGLKNTNPKERRFQQVQSGAKNCIFIKTTLPNPDEIVRDIFNKVYESERSISRYIMRLYAVLGTCKSTDEAIKKLGEKVLEPYFTDRIGRSFSIQCKVRNNNSITKMDVINCLVDVIKYLNPANRADLDGADYFVIVDVIRRVCCISVVTDYQKFRKYNLQEAVGAKQALRAKTESAGSKPETQVSGDAATTDPTPGGDDGETMESSSVGETVGSSAVGETIGPSAVGEIVGSSAVGEAVESSAVGEAVESSAVGEAVGSSAVGEGDDTENPVKDDIKKETVNTDVKAVGDAVGDTGATAILQPQGLEKNAELENSEAQDVKTVTDQSPS